MSHYGNEWWLTVRKGPDSGLSHPLQGGVIKIGRAQDNDIILQDSAVSRYHARILLQGGSFILEDLGSANGTTVNNVRTSGRTQLHPGDVVGLGSTVTLALTDQPGPRIAGPRAAAGAVEDWFDAEETSGGGLPGWLIPTLVALGVVVVGIVAAILLLGKDKEPGNVVYVTATWTTTSGNAPGTTPKPSDTPVPGEPPTYTPYPTYTPIPTLPPTYTPYPTYTPIPTSPPTYTPNPTYTPYPTQKPPPPPTKAPTQQPPPPTQQTQAAYSVAINKSIYEPWGRPQNSDGCNKPYRDRDPVRRLTIELVLTNQSRQTIPTNWYPVFYTANGTVPITCIWNYDDRSVPPGQTKYVTFATHIEQGEWISRAVLDEIGYTLVICLNQAGQRVSCQ